MQKGFDALYSFLLLRFEEDCLKVALGLWVVFTSLKGLQIATPQKDQGKQSRNSNMEQLCKWVGDLIWVVRLFDFLKSYFNEFIALALGFLSTWQNDVWAFRTSLCWEQNKECSCHLRSEPVSCEERFQVVVVFPGGTRWISFHTRRRM